MRCWPTAPGDFVGVVLAGGSHVDSMLGVNPIFDLVLQLVTKRVPAGNTAAVYTLSTGWINDMYRRHTPTTADMASTRAPTRPSSWAPPLPRPAQPEGQPALPARKDRQALIDAVGGLFGFSSRTRSTPAATVSPVCPPPLSNGVTGVRTGAATLDIPCGANGYAAPADWYFPTQADGTVQANGVIWLQHGFLGFKSWYSDRASSWRRRPTASSWCPTSSGSTPRAATRQSRQAPTMFRGRGRAERQRPPAGRTANCRRSSSSPATRPAVTSPRPSARCTSEPLRSTTSSAW